MFHSSLRSVTLCTHCGGACSSSGIRLGEALFCCEGCKQVYQILKENNLCEFYSLNDHPGKTQIEPRRKDKYAFLDNPAIADKLIKYRDKDQSHVNFYIPQIHCSSCLWLLENLYRINPAIYSSRVNFTSREVFIQFRTPDISLRQVVETLDLTGYAPVIHLTMEMTGKDPVVPDRSRWYKIGLAGFAFANIMMLSLPEYLLGSGALEKDIQVIFTIIKIVLSIPVLVYAASEFFISAWKGIRARYLNIDLPVALALVITFFRSLYEIATQTGTGYLDSMSGIVFFMLVGRWLQDKTYASISFERDFCSFFPISVNKQDADGVRPIPVEQIKKNDIIHIHDSELIPVDGILLEGKGLMDYSFVTGEAEPVAVAEGETIYAGGRQKSGKIKVKVLNPVSQSYLTQLWNQTQKASKSNSDSTSFIDLLSTKFTYIVLALSAIAAIYWYTQAEYDRLWNAVTTVLIVACPCALLLASNFTRGNMLRILGRNRIYLKNAGILERLIETDTVVFDKTGTLTKQNEMQVTYSGSDLTVAQMEEIASILVHSAHPMSKAIVNYLKVETPETPDSFKTHLHQGVEAWIRDHHYKIGSPSFTGIETEAGNGSHVGIICDSIKIGVFTIQQVFREGVGEMFDQIKSSHKVSLLSGDNDRSSKVLSQMMGTDAELRFTQSPVDKLNYIHSLVGSGSNVIMVGDGLNDAGALAVSQVGIAVTQDDNNFTPAADGIIHASQISRLPSIIGYARSGRKILLLGFILSILYNIIGLYFALQGILSPVIAAILMPASSISIILLTTSLTRKKATKHGFTP